MIFGLTWERAFDLPHLHHVDDLNRLIGGMMSYITFINIESGIVRLV